MQTTVDRDGAVHNEVFHGKNDEDIQQQMDTRLEELKSRGHTFVRRFPKIGRNHPCPCGSGKKFKKCHIFKQSEL